MAVFMSTELQGLREKQLNSLMQACPEVQTRVAGKVFFSTFNTASGLSIQLFITLPDDFPFRPPTLHVEPRIVSPIVSQDGRILPAAHSALQSWSIHSSLGRTIAEIKSHLAASAMPFTTSSMLPGSLALGGSPTTSIGGSMNTMRPGLTPGSSGSLLGPTISPSSILQPSQVTQPPAASGTAGGLLPEIAALTDDQVSQVLSDEKAFEAFFESLERVRAIREQEYKLNISNRDIATANVAKAQEVERLRADVLLKRQELQATRTEYDALALQKQELAKLYDRDTLVEKLTQAADQADQQSEDIVSQFMSGAMDFATFVHKYKEARILYHQRAAKRESLLMHRPR